MLKLETQPTCPDCGVGIGEPHKTGLCDVERCSICKGQRLGCGCEQHTPEAVAWDGTWPGTKECWARGWFAKMVPGKGWVSCSVYEAEIEDYNRWVVFSISGIDPGPSG